MMNSTGSASPKSLLPQGFSKYFRHLLGAIALLIVSAAACRAESAQIVFMGETFLEAHKDIRDEGTSLVEFVRSGETVENWKKLLGVFRYANSEQSPKDAVLGVANVLKKRDPQALFSMKENSQTQEAIIDFVMKDETRNAVEFNVFKFARNPHGKGLIAFQYAQRFDVAKNTPEELARVRVDAILAAAKFDLLSAAGNYFAK